MEINSGVHLLKSQICEVPLFTSGGLGLGVGLVILVFCYFGLGLGFGLKNLVLFASLVSMTSKLIAVGQTVSCERAEIVSRLSRSLEVIKSGTDRSGIPTTSC